jgi:transketolase
VVKITNLKKLYLKSNDIRQDLIKQLVKAGSGHTAGPLGMADVFTALYFNVLTHNPKKPNWNKRDRVVLSNGHICPVWYPTLAHAGYFPKKELATLRKLGTRLQGHPHRNSVPGVEHSAGPLGQGLSIAIGLALAATLNKEKHRIYCLTSDGEHEEGQTMEAMMYAGNKNVTNLTAIMDRNNIQIDGDTEDIMGLEPLREKYEAFNWHVIDVDGHNIQQIINACREAKAVREKPTMILAHTTPGKGVSFTENDYRWHGKPPTKEQAKIALAELKVRRKFIQKHGIAP